MLFLMRSSVTKLAGKCFPEFPKMCPTALQFDAAAEYVGTGAAPARTQGEAARWTAADLCNFTPAQSWSACAAAAGSGGGGAPESEPNNNNNAVFRLHPSGDQAVP